jgi:ribonuclease HII
MITMLRTRFSQDSSIEIGIDEAGRGSFWGPLMAGAVIIPDESEWNEVQTTLMTELRDSKKISPKKRERLYNDIKEHIIACNVGIVYANEINENGITWANQEAFRRAVNGLGLETLENTRLIIDGTLKIPNWQGEQEVIVEGDGKYIAIAAASILAKVEHDKWIQSYCEGHPECDERYDLVKSKGYGTASHREGIGIYGGHTLHRNLYIQNWLPESRKTGGVRDKCDKKSKKATDEKCLIKF